MIVPTTNYSPLIQAKTQETQAKKTRFIAPQIDYQTQSLELQRKGLERTQSHIAEQKNIYQLKFGYEVGKTMVEACFAAAAAQQAAASQAKVSQMAKEFKTYEMGLTASGEFGVEAIPNGTGGTYLNVKGMDKLKEFQNEQIQALKDEGWMPKIENNAISTMQGIYAGNQQSLLQDFYAKETNDRHKLEMLNLQEAIDADIAGTAYDVIGSDDNGVRSNAMGSIQVPYSRAERYIDSLQGPMYTPSYKVALKKTAKEEIEFGQNANIVRDETTRNGLLAGLNMAQTISTRNDYNPQTQQKLEGFAESTAKQNIQVASLEGAKLVSDVISANPDNPDFPTMRQTAEASLQNRPEEYKEAYMNAVEKGQLKFLSDKASPIITRADKMTDVEIEDAIKMVENDPNYQGSIATQALQDTILDKLEGQLSKRVTPELQAKVEDLVNDYEDMIIKNKDFSEENIERIRKKIENETLLSRDLEHGLKDNRRPLLRKLDQSVLAHEIGEEKAKKEYTTALAKAIDATMDKAVQDLDSGRMNGYQAMDFYDGVINNVLPGARGNLSEDKFIELNNTADKLRNNIIPDTEKRYKTYFDDVSRFIRTQYENKYGKYDSLSKEQQTELNERLKYAHGKLLDLALESGNYADDKMQIACEKIKTDSLLDNYDALNTPNQVKANAKDSQFKASMRDINDITNSNGVYYDDRNGEFVWAGKTKEKFDSASLNLRDMLEKDYGLDVKNEYRTQEIYDQNGEKHILPVYISEYNDNIEYTVYNDRVYSVYWTNYGRGEDQQRIYRISSNPIGEPVQEPVKYKNFK